LKKLPLKKLSSLQRGHAIALAFTYNIVQENRFRFSLLSVLRECNHWDVDEKAPAIRRENEQLLRGREREAEREKENSRESENERKQVGKDQTISLHRLPCSRITRAARENFRRGKRKSRVLC